MMRPPVNLSRFIGRPAAYCTTSRKSISVSAVILGILSDTHGRSDMAAAAIKLLLSRGAEYLIHCGDVGSDGVLDQLAGHRATFVFGNNDWDRAGLSRYAKDLGVVCGDDHAKLSFDGKLVVVTHGDDSRFVSRVLQEQRVDYLFLGHTHKTMDQRQGKVRVINPGALHRAAEKTVAVLDTQTDVLEFLHVAEGKHTASKGF
jgi:putative phosphoesterase